MSDTEREMPAEYVPTADQRALVENAAAFGLTQADIAEQLKIDEKTLRKHFREEHVGQRICRCRGLAPAYAWFRRAPCKPLSVRYRTGLCTAETEIGKPPAETAARNPPHTDRNTGNRRPETGVPQPNLRECRRFSPTGK